MFGEYIKAVIRGGGELTVQQMTDGKFQGKINYRNLSEMEIRGDGAKDEEGAVENLEEAIKIFNHNFIQINKNLMKITNK